MAIIGREFKHDSEGKPILILKPIIRDNRKRFVVPLNTVWKYSEDHNEQFESFLANRVMQLCQLFDIQIPKGKKQFTQLMSHISQVIMEGIDDLVKMAPAEPKRIIMPGDMNFIIH